MATTAERTSASPVDTHAAPTAETANRSGKATASFIVGIVSVIAFLIPILGVILGIIAVALAASGRAEAKRSRKTNTWMANAGLALGTLAIVISIAVVVAAVASS
jgi:hypothetical protein